MKKINLSLLPILLLPFFLGAFFSPEAHAAAGGYDRTNVAQIKDFIRDTPKDQITQQAFIDMGYAPADIRQAFGEMDLPSSPPPQRASPRPGRRSPSPGAAGGYNVRAVGTIRNMLANEPSLTTEQLQGMGFQSADILQARQEMGLPSSPPPQRASPRPGRRSPSPGAAGGYDRTNVAQIKDFIRDTPKDQITQQAFIDMGYAPADIRQAFWEMGLPSSPPPQRASPRPHPRSPSPGPGEPTAVVAPPPIVPGIDIVESLVQDHPEKDWPQIVKGYTRPTDKQKQELLAEAKYLKDQRLRDFYNPNVSPQEKQKIAEMVYELRYGWHSPAPARTRPPVAPKPKKGNVPAAVLSSLETDQQTTSFSATPGSFRPIPAPRSRVNQGGAALHRTGSVSGKKPIPAPRRRSSGGFVQHQNSAGLDDTGPEPAEAEPASSNVPPPPPAPPPPPPAPFFGSAQPKPDRGALLAGIEKGVKLRKAPTNDRSAARLSATGSGTAQPSASASGGGGAAAAARPTPNPAPEGLMGELAALLKKRKNKEE